MASNAEFIDIVKDLHAAATLALQSTDPSVSAMQMRLAQTFSKKLLESRRRAGPDVRLRIDAHMRNFFAGFDSNPVAERVQAFKHDQLRSWYFERLNIIDLVCKGHNSVHLRREAKDICRAVVRACDLELGTTPATRLGKTRLRLVR